MSTPSTALVPHAPPQGEDELRRSIDRAGSHDLVFAIVGHVGAGASYVAAILAEELRAAGYQPRNIKASKLIEATASARGLLHLSLARTGGVSARGATLYCTTYPCHNCARHIVASGIREVIYIEPYTKSRAIGLHSDSILETTQRWSHTSTKVHSRLFSGVAPRRFSVVFHKRQELKDKQGMLIYPPQESPLHQDPVFARSLDDFERQVAGYITKVEAEEVRI